MEIYQAIILGIVQGLSEFLPISSSGHLIIVPYLFGWKEHTLTFDLVLHLATAFAVLVFFYKDWLGMTQNLLVDLESTIKSHKYSNIFSYQKNFKSESALLINILLATIPVGIIGLLFEKKFEDYFRSPLIVAFNLIIFGMLLYIIDSKKRYNVSDKNITLITVLIIALSQILAMVPGVSRSGITLIAALLIGFSRVDAVKYSFLLATPLIVLGGLKSLLELLMDPMNDISLIVMLFGFLASFVSGFFVIGFLLDWVKKRSLAVFTIYRVLVGVLLLYFALW